MQTLVIIHTILGEVYEVCHGSETFIRLNHTPCICCDILAAKCREQIGLHSLVQELLLITNTFSTMIFDLLNRLALQQQSLVAMVLWSLWRNRNSKL